MLSYLLYARTAMPRIRFFTSQCSLKVNRTVALFLVLRCGSGGFRRSRFSQGLRTSGGANGGRIE